MAVSVDWPVGSVVDGSSGSGHGGGEDGSVGHGMVGHGVVSRYSDLHYSGQSGGINEAFADMSGEVAELYSLGENDWEVNTNNMEQILGH